MVAVADTRSNQGKRAKGPKGKHTSFPLLYCMPDIYPWVGTVLILPITVLDNEPITKGTLSCL